LKNIHKNILTSRNTTSLKTNEKFINQPISAVNPLDSTSVLQKRGKEREIRKQKKPSTLKKIILKEREEKRRAKQDTSNKPNELSIDLVNALTSTNSFSNTLSPRCDGLNLVTVELNKLCLNLSKNELTPRAINSSLSSNESESTTKDEQVLKENSENTQPLEHKEERKITAENNHNNSLNDDDDPNDDNESVKTFTLTNSNNETTVEQQKDKIEEHEDDDEEDDDDDAVEISKENDDMDENQEESADTRSEKYSQTMSPISQGSPLSINGFYSPSVNYMATEQNLISLDKLEEQVKKKIHSRKFRE